MHYSLHYLPGHNQQHLKGSRYLLSISVKITAFHVLMSNKLKIVVQQNLYEFLLWYSRDSVSIAMLGHRIEAL